MPDLPPHQNTRYSTDDDGEYKAIVPTETPLAISYNEVNHAVMMVTPQDIEDFIFGFSLTEQIIQSRNEIHDISVTQQGDALIANVALANRAQARLSQAKRQIAGRTGCGICGAESLEHAMPTLPALDGSTPLDNDVIKRIRSEFRQWQVLGNVSGAIHAALLLDTNGKIILCKEDIGRHNALDKLLGCAFKNQELAQGQTLVVTSRCSIELVQKAVIAGIGSLITLGTPTSLAISVAKKSNLNLIHLPRKDEPRFYTP